MKRLIWCFETGICALLLLVVSACEAKDPLDGDSLARARHEMVEKQIVARGIETPAVVAALRKVPRHEFVPIAYREESYVDSPLPIGEGQTISQPFIVALMTALVYQKPGSKILEIGTGSGYQAAVLAEMAEKVYTIEIVPELAEKSKTTLQRLGYENIEFRQGDGYLGWPEAAPFDGIIVTAAPGHVPQPLVDQLKIGANLVIPVGEGVQQLKVIAKTEEGLVEKNALAVRFVPMTGKAEEIGADGK